MDTDHCFCVERSLGRAGGRYAFLGACSMRPVCGRVTTLHTPEQIMRGCLCNGRGSDCVISPSFFSPRRDFKAVPNGHLELWPKVYFFLSTTLR